MLAALALAARSARGALGVARAFKTPNLFQLNPNCVHATQGNGCPVVNKERLSGPCQVLGNPDLEAEKSLNKEIGFVLFDKTVLRTNGGGGANMFNEPGRAFHLSLNRSF